MKQKKIRIGATQQPNIVKVFSSDTPGLKLLSSIQVQFLSLRSRVYNGIVTCRITLIFVIFFV